jgi:hypothetical protein
MRYSAIYNTHPTVVSINAETEAWDKDGNVVVLDESKITTEIARLQAEFDAQEYARNRQEEYPTIAELTVALYDTDDKAALETKRAAVKTKWPKNNTGPVE